MPRSQPSRKIPMPDLLTMPASGRELLVLLDDKLCAALLDPRNEQLWDDAGLLRARAVRHPAASALLAVWKINPNLDLDRMQPALRRRLHS